jgi:hypothetical protein
MVDFAFDIYTAMGMESTVLWVVTPYSRKEPDVSVEHISSIFRVEY